MNVILNVNSKNECNFECKLDLKPELKPRVMKYNVRFKLEQRKDIKGKPDENGTIPLVNKKVPIQADITYSGTRLYYFTGYRIDADKFDKEQQQVRKNAIGFESQKPVPYNEINNRLRKIRAELELFFSNKTHIEDKTLIIKLLDEACKKAEKQPKDIVQGYTFFDLFQKYIEVVNISDGRKRHIKTVKCHWEKYEATIKPHITFESFNIDLLRGFERYLATDKTKPKGRNTLHTIMKITRSFWNFAIIEMKNQGTILPQVFGINGYKLPEEVYGRPIYITDFERDMIYDAKLEDTRLDWVRDVFIFQCHVGARIGDLVNFTKANVSNGVLSYIARKTKDNKPITISIPLTKVAQEIIDKYDLPDGRLLPFRSEVKYNKYLKELFEKVGLTRLVTRPNPTTRESENVRICDIASSHMARRTFIGNKYGKFSDGVLVSMTGHVNDSKALSRYYDVSDELKRRALGIS